MREIKFRAWDKENNQMFKDVFVGSGFVEYLMSCHGTFENFAPMQFTGLLDKNGKEIYEGDIIQDERVIDEFPDHKEIVKFGEHTTDSGYGDGVTVYGWYSEYEGHINYTTSLIPDDAKYMEVIGNIYEGEK